MFFKYFVVKIFVDEGFRYIASRHYKILLNFQRSCQSTKNDKMMYLEKLALYGTCFFLGF